MSMKFQVGSTQEHAGDPAHRNSAGFRCSELDALNTDAVWFVGCSNTYGIGVEHAHTVCSVFADRMQLPVENLGWPGTGIETHTRLLSEMFCTVGKPKAVVYGHSGLGRRLDYYDTDSGGVHSATFFPFISTKVIVNDGGSSRSAGRLTAWATRSDTEMRAWYEHNWCVFRGLCVDVPLISWCTMPEYEEMIRSVDSQCLPWPGKIDTGTDGLHPGVGWHRKAELSIRRRYQELV